ncbi:OB-fold putative lipoprotein [Oxalobacter sp. OttesenSCG-928-P03]|nr:OB-fold putative lipoprotein [Oxalobacter sp. OttesenSCG-928-P03]
MKKTMAILACCVIGLSACGGGSGDKSTAKSTEKNTEKSGSNQSALNQDGVKFAKMFFADEITRSIDADTSRIPQSEAFNLIKIHGRVSSESLSKSYSDNEQAADGKYKNKTMIVSGKVRSVSKDSSDTPYLQLNGDGMMKMVNAYFDRKNAGELPKISVNQSVNLVCDVKNYMIGQVVLKECKTLSPYAKEKITALTNSVPDVLSGQKTIAKESDNAIKLGYAISAKLPKTSTCWSNIRDKKCEEDMKNIPK